jgi:hypothetical protein
VFQQLASWSSSVTVQVIHRPKLSAVIAVFFWPECVPPDFSESLNAIINAYCRGEDDFPPLKDVRYLLEWGNIQRVESRQNRNR